jgi:hypothetical protein
LAVVLLVQAGALAATPNDDCADAIDVATLPYQHQTDTATATTEASDPMVSCDGIDFGQGLHSVWYRYTAVPPITLDIDTLDSGVALTGGTVIAVHRGTCGALTQIACNDQDYDNRDSTDLSRTLATLELGETVLIEVLQPDQFGNDGGPTIVTVRESSVFQVNPSPEQTYTQGFPAVAVRSDGRFVVVWSEHDGGDYGIVARPYAANGFPASLPVRIDAAGTDATRPEVAADGAGNFVAAWADSGGARARRFDQNGTPLGAEIAVSGSAYGYVDVGAAADGGFVVAWEDGVVGGVSARVFDENDLPVTGPIALQASDAEWPKVAVNGDGTFVAAWTDRSGADGDEEGVYAQRYDADGNALDTAFLVNEGTVGSQGDAGPAISADTNGNFVVAWEDNASTRRLSARRFDAAGTPLGGDFQVDEGVGGGYHEYPAVAHGVNGYFTVAWAASYDGPMVRQFAPTGASDSPQLRAGHLPDNLVYGVDVGAGSGDYVVVWDWSPVDEDVFINALRILPQPTPVCTEQPRSGCKESVVAGKSSLTIKDKTPDTGDRFIWKWLKGEATHANDINAPGAARWFSLCVYDDDGLGGQEPVATADIRTTGTCNGLPCWRSFTPYKYIEKKALSDGIAKVILTVGPEGAPKAIVKGKGRRLRQPTLPLDPPVTVQLVESNGTCFTTTYDANVTTNTPDAFVAKAD